MSSQGISIGAPGTPMDPTACQRYGVPPGSLWGGSSGSRTGVHSDTDTTHHMHTGYSVPPAPRRPAPRRPAPAGPRRRPGVCAHAGRRPTRRRRRRQESGVDQADLNARYARLEEKYAAMEARHEAEQAENGDPFEGVDMEQHSLSV